MFAQHMTWRWTRRLVASLLTASWCCLPAHVRAAVQLPRPPRVADDAKDFGGGSADTLGHGLPMQQNGKKTPVEELQDIPTWEVFYEKYVRQNKPVVLRGHAQGQQAFKLWTDTYLANKWGSRVINARKTKQKSEEVKPLRCLSRIF